MALFVPWPVTRTVPDAFIACHPPPETVRKKEKKGGKKRKKEGKGEGGGDWHKFAPRLTFASNYSRRGRGERGRQIRGRNWETFVKFASSKREAIYIYIKKKN